MQEQLQRVRYNVNVIFFNYLCVFNSRTLVILIKSKKSELAKAVIERHKDFCTREEHLTFFLILYYNM